MTIKITELPQVVESEKVIKETIITEESKSAVSVGVIIPSIPTVENVPKRRKRINKEAPYLPLLKTKAKEVLDTIFEFYKLKETFPTNLLMVRSEESPKMYLVSGPMLDIIKADSDGILKIVNTGLRLFMKASERGTRCNHRISSESVEFIFPYISDRVVDIEEKDFVIALTQTNPFVSTFSTTVSAALSALDPGCFVFLFKTPKLERNLVVPAWRGKNSCHLLMAAADLRVLRILFAPEFAVKDAKDRKKNEKNTKKRRKENTEQDDEHKNKRQAVEIDPEVKGKEPVEKIEVEDKQVIDIISDGDDVIDDGNMEKMDE